MITATNTEGDVVIEVDVKDSPCGPFLFTWIFGEWPDFEICLNELGGCGVPCSGITKGPRRVCLGGWPDLVAHEIRWTCFCNSLVSGENPIDTNCVPDDGCLQVIAVQNLDFDSLIPSQLMS